MPEPRISHPSDSPPPPSRASLRAWWKQFTTSQRIKKDIEEPEQVTPRIFGVPLRESLRYASVPISTANTNGELYVWGYIPVVVAKCGLYLKENATEAPGTFRVSGSAKRMRELQALFEKPPRYAKTLDLKQWQYTTHDVASVFRRYLTSMPEPVIPHEHYHDFRSALAKIPFFHDECIQTYKRLIRSMPRANQYLLLYVLDLLSVFSRKSDKNLMTATNLAVIFRPGIISHPDHEMSPDQHKLSQDVLEFLIAQQDWFMLDIPPPPSEIGTASGSTVDQEGGRQDNDGDDDVSVMIVHPSDEEENGWRVVERRGRQGRSRQPNAGRGSARRRATSASERSSGLSSPVLPSSRTPPPMSSSPVRLVSEHVGSLVEGDMGAVPTLANVSTRVARSQTMPARPRVGRHPGEERHRNVLKKGRAGRMNPPPPSDDSG